MLCPETKGIVSCICTVSGFSDSRLRLRGGKEDSSGVSAAVEPNKQKILCTIEDGRAMPFALHHISEAMFDYKMIQYDHGDRNCYFIV